MTSYIPTAELYEDINTELRFVLPSECRSTGEFTQLFRALEDNMAVHGIKSYGVSDTTLEEVRILFCGEGAGCRGDKSREYPNRVFYCLVRQVRNKQI